MFHQFIKRDKSDQIVLNIDTLAALAAALVRRAYIDCLDQLMCGVRRQLIKIGIFLNSLNEQLKILVLLFLYFDLSPETLGLGFQSLLLFLVTAAHTLKPLIAQLSGHIVLIGSHKQTVELLDTFLRFLKLLALGLEDRRALCLELLFDDRPEVCFIAQDKLNYSLRIVPDQGSLNR